MYLCRRRPILPKYPHWQYWEGPTAHIFHRLARFESFTRLWDRFGRWAACRRYGNSDRKGILQSANLRWQGARRAFWVGTLPGACYRAHFGRVRCPDRRIGRYAGRAPGPLGIVQYSLDNGAFVYIVALRIWRSGRRRDTAATEAAAAVLGTHVRTACMRGTRMCPPCNGCGAFRDACPKRISQQDECARCRRRV